MFTQAQLQEITQRATKYAIEAALELQKHPSVNVHPDDLRVQTPQHKVRTLAQSYETSRQLADAPRNVIPRTIRLNREHVGHRVMVIDRKGNAHHGRLAYSVGQWVVMNGGREVYNFHQTNRTSITHTHKGMVIRA